MQLTAELTVYPFQTDYKDTIRHIVARLNAYDDIKVRTFPTATILVGNYDRVMGVVNEVIKWSYLEHGKCVFVAKFLPGYEAE
jgi:uncharacterized protein YqgV (UPF0045/DUF77 family)